MGGVEVGRKVKKNFALSVSGDKDLGLSVGSMRSLSVSTSGELQGSVLQGRALSRPVCSGAWGFRELCPSPTGAWVNVAWLEPLCLGGREMTEGRLY